jgi:predicted transcriptional regulator
MSQNKKRLQFDFSDEAVERIDFIAEKMNASSRAEVIRRSLEILDNIIKWKESGGELILKEKNGKEKTIVVL